MQPEEEVAAKRKIDALLDEDSYQGMTDEEIQDLIDYYKNDSYQKGYNAAKAEEAQQVSAAILSQMKTMQEQAHSRYLDALAIKTTFERTTGDI